MCIKEHIIRYFDDQKSDSSSIAQSLLTFEVLGDRIVVKSKREGREFVVSIPLESTSVMCTHKGVSFVHRNHAGLPDERIKITFSEIGLSLSNAWFPKKASANSFGIVEWVYKAQKHRTSLPVVVMRYLTGHSKRPRSMGSALFRLGGIVLLGFFILLAFQMIVLSSERTVQNQALIEPSMNQGVQSSSLPAFTLKDEETMRAANQSQKTLENIRQVLKNKEKEQEANRARLGGLSEGDGQSMESWTPKKMETIVP